MVRLIKKSLLVFIFLHTLFLLIIILKNGLNIRYFFLFFLSIILFGIILFLYSRIVINTSNPRFFIQIILMDVSIFICFLYILFGNEYVALLSFLFWIIIPLRNIMVIFSIKYKIGEKY